MTKKNAFEIIRSTMADNAEIVAFCDHEIELLDKRNASRSTKPTKAQLERQAQYDHLIGFLSDNAESTCGDVAEFLGVTLHSATGLLTQLRKNGQVARSYKGKTPVYSIGSEVVAE